MSVIVLQVDADTVALGEAWGTKTLAFDTRRTRRAFVAAASTVKEIFLGVHTSSKADGRCRRWTLGEAGSSVTNLTLTAGLVALSTMLVVVGKGHTAALTGLGARRTLTTSREATSAFFARLVASAAVKIAGRCLKTSSAADGGRGFWAERAAGSVHTSCVVGAGSSALSAMLGMGLSVGAGSIA